MVLTAPVVAFILYRIQHFYLRTSRQMRLLDLEAKSPVYQHFTETVEGLATIRAFGWQASFKTEALQRIEESQKPHYLLTCIQLWLAVVLDLMSSTLAVLLVTLALFIPASSNPGSIGVGLITAMTINSSLQSIIQSWAQAETSLGSIARTRSYEQDTPNENFEEKKEPEPNWPHGSLHVSNITVTYATGTSALKKINIHVEVGKKLGICGRTGR
jgi:ATP-binding cassette subfamily C (CFTR/MRP) protein 1